MKNIIDLFLHPLAVIIVSLLATPVFSKNLHITVLTTPGLDKPITELAGEFTKNYGIDIRIMSGKIDQIWMNNANNKVDIIICGAGYQLNQLISALPDLIVKTSRTSLPPRSSAFLTRKGDSKRIASFSDLSKPGIKLLVVDGADQVGLWEDMVAKKQTLEKIRANIAVSVKSNIDAIQQWESKKDLDAWITFQSWHNYVKGSTRLIKVLDHYKRFRGTPIAITKSSKHKTQAKQFVDFLTSKQNLKTYEKWGW